MRSRGALVSAAVAVGLLLLPTLGLLGPAVAAPATSSTRSFSAVLAPGVPSVLTLPFADRAGYEAGSVATVADAVPAADSRVLVAITFLPRDASFFSTAPTSGGRGLDAATVAAEFAPPSADRGALVSYLEGHGLTVVHAWPDGLALTVAGPASSVGPAFGTSLYDGLWQGHAVRFPAAAPSLPSPWESEVAAISGLSSGFTAFEVPLATVPTTSPQAVRTTSVITPSAVHQVYDLDGLYNFSGTPHWARGVGIALVLWGEGYAPSDLQGFFSNYYPAGFPPVPVNYLPVDGAPAPSESAVFDPSNVTSEMTLDIEWAGSAAPGANLTAVYAPDGPASNHYSPDDAALEDAINTAIQSTGASVVSMSFGTPDGSDPSFQAAVSVSLADAQQRGVTVLAASGDTGGALKADCSGGPSPEFPASSPLALAIGGTAPVLGLDAFGQVTGIDNEPAWNRSGGGYSPVYPAGTWQSQLSSRRAIPDVAGPAADNIFYYHGSEAAGAGTSFAAPFWAGLVAEMDAIHGSPLGFLSPRLYAVGANDVSKGANGGLVDITSGANCLGFATAGWDDVTGWGTPRGLALYEELSGTFVNVTLSVSSSNIAPGSSFSATVVVTNVTTGRPVGDVNVTYLLSSVGYVGPCSGSLQVLTAAVGASGTSSNSLTVPGCYLGSAAQLTATVSGRGYVGSATVQLSVNIIGLAGFLAVVQVFPYNIIAFAAIMVAATLIGWRVGSWRDRRARARRPAAPPAPGTPAGPGETRPADRPPPRTAGPGAAAANGVAPPGGPVPPIAAAPSVPAHVLEPPSAPPPLDGSPTNGSGGPPYDDGLEGSSPGAPRTCPTCGAAVPAFDAACPVCRTTVG